jgi:hypothetical protein
MRMVRLIAIQLDAQYLCTGLQLEQNEETDETAEVTWGGFVF